MGYFLGMFCGHWLLPTHNKTIFLDKACIRQCHAQHDGVQAETEIDSGNISSVTCHQTLSSGSRVRFEAADCPACLEMRAGIERIGEYGLHVPITIHETYHTVGSICLCAT